MIHGLLIVNCVGGSLKYELYDTRTSTKEFIIGAMDWNDSMLLFSKKSALYGQGSSEQDVVGRFERNTFWNLPGTCSYTLFGQRGEKEYIISIKAPVYSVRPIELKIKGVPPAIARSSDIRGHLNTDEGDCRCTFPLLFPLQGCFPETGTGKYHRLYVDGHEEEGADRLDQENIRANLRLQTQSPRWNTELRSFMLSFGGRAKYPAQSNFVICEPQRQQSSSPTQQGEHNGSRADTSGVLMGTRGVESDTARWYNMNGQKFRTLDAVPDGPDGPCKTGAGAGDMNATGEPRVCIRFGMMDKQGSKFALDFRSPGNAALALATAVGTLRFLQSNENSAH
jgi:hypothetical protein